MKIKKTTPLKILLILLIFSSLVLTSCETEQTPDTSDDQTEILSETETCPPFAILKIDSYCRLGPGEMYETAGVFSQGESTEVKGRSADSNWWVIDQPDDPGICWIWNDFVDLEPKTCDVAVVEAPPFVDLDPPPAPVLEVPADGTVLDCLSTQNLTWTPVEDPSGIAGYNLIVKKEVSGSWQNEYQLGSLTENQQEIDLECGSNYRWAVQAEDQAGNISPWSVSSAFSVNLE